jgi:hypothetical protein
LWSLDFELVPGRLRLHDWVLPKTAIESTNIQDIVDDVEYEHDNGRLSRKSRPIASMKASGPSRVSPKIKVSHPGFHSKPKAYVSNPISPAIVISAPHICES